MPVSIIQRADMTRLDIAFCNGEVEGFLRITDIGDKALFTPFNLDEVKLGEPVENAHDAAIAVITDYQQRELSVVDAQIVALESSRDTATGLSLKLLPRRIDSARAYREKVAAGKFTH